MDRAKAIVLAEFGVSVEEWIRFQEDNELGKRVRQVSSFLSNANGNFSVTSCKCRPTGVPLYYYHVRIYSSVTVLTKSHPNHTCRDKEWDFLWSRRPWLSWAKILFIIVSQYSCTVT